MTLNIVIAIPYKHLVENKLIYDLSISIWSFTSRLVLVEDKSNEKNKLYRKAIPNISIFSIKKQWQQKNKNTYEMATYNYAIQR